MMQHFYRGSLFAALADLFPSVRPWQVPLRTPRDYWKGEQGRERAPEATRWLLAQLDLEGAEPAHIAARVTRPDFVRLGFGVMLKHVYGNDPRLALADVLPEVPS